VVHDWKITISLADHTVTAIEALSTDLEGFLREAIEQEITRRTQLAALWDIAGLWSHRDDIPDTPEAIVNFVRHTAERYKPVHIISTDTGVEQPLVAQWANHGLVRMQDAASVQGLPIHPHRLHPDPAQSLWANLIGRGYGAPQQASCTNRLKISPANRLINDLASSPELIRYHETNGGWHVCSLGFFCGTYRKALLVCADKTRWGMPCDPECVMKGAQGPRPLMRWPIPSRHATQA